jgi:hypothetical protein
LGIANSGTTGFAPYSASAPVSSKETKFCTGACSESCGNVTAAGSGATWCPHDVNVSAIMTAQATIRTMLIIRAFKEAG